MAETVLVDTSVWVGHLRHGDSSLEKLLEEGAVSIHPFVVGELACGNLKNRIEILSLLRALPAVAVAEHDEVMTFIEKKQLMGKGLGYVDAHLLASVTLSNVRLWTMDRSLAGISTALRLSYNP